MRDVAAVQDLQICVATWNAGSAVPDAQELGNWLPHGGAGLDVVVIGTQENSLSKKRKEEGAGAPPPMASSDSSVEAIADANWAEAAEQGDWTEADDVAAEADDAEVEIIGDVPGGTCAPCPVGGRLLHAWDAMCAERLGSEWVCAANISLREMRLSVYCTRKISKSVRHISTRRKATGIGGVYGNKGGLAVQMAIGSTTYAFVSCHLAAGEQSASNLKARNTMGRKVLQSTEWMGKRRQLDVVHFADHVIFMGDLNYRIDLSLIDRPADNKDTHIAAVRALANNKQYAALMSADELCRAQRDGHAFVGFTEGSYNFAPTYKTKRQVGMTYVQNRTPSYTDRILWRSMPALKGRLVQESLTSVPSVSTSDHKPLVARFKASPRPFIERAHVVTATVAFSELSVRDVRGLGAGSQLFCQFFINPQGLLRKHLGSPPRTSLATGGAEGSTPAAFTVAPLRLAVPVPKIGECCLLIGVYQKTRFSKRLLGVVPVSLAALEPSAAGGASSASKARPQPNDGDRDDRNGDTLSDSSRRSTTQRGIHKAAVDVPLESGHSTDGTGWLSYRLQVERRDGASGGFSVYQKMKQFVFSRQVHKREQRSREAVAQGAYSHAAAEIAKTVSMIDIGMQEMSSNDEEVSDAVVKANVKVLTTQAEMIYRYKQFEKGASPREQATSTLLKARRLLDRQEASSPASAAEFRAQWAAELSAVLQGLSVTELLFGDETDHPTIEAQLKEALALRETGGLQRELADTLNSLGMLKKKQKLYDAAEGHFQRSLDVRRQLVAGAAGGDGSGGDDASSNRDPEQVIAQSLVSLGGLALERGDAAKASDDLARARIFWGQARGHYAAATQAYLEGHPKAWWAHYGLGNVSEREGDDAAALVEFDRAASILSALKDQDKSKSKDSFGSERAMVDSKRDALRQRAAMRP